MMKDQVDRRTAIELALLMLGGAAITVSGCGGGGGSSNPTNPNPPAASGDKTGVISANHGHTATLAAAELTAGNGLNLGFLGTATHTHSITITGAEVVQIRDGQRKQFQSTVNDSHTHTVSFN
jgi:hypothetical protein